MALDATVLAKNIKDEIDVLISTSDTKDINNLVDIIAAKTLSYISTGLTLTVNSMSSGLLEVGAAISGPIVLSGSGVLFTAGIT